MEKKDPDRKIDAPKASTADVLGTAAEGFKIDPKWEKQYRALSGLREKLLSRRKDLVSLASEEKDLPQRNMAELGTDSFDRDFALGMASSEQEILYEIEHALDRIRRGRYGICELTGRPIEPERLQAVPWTRYSTEAVKKLEAEAQAPHPRVGQREEIPKEPVTDQSAEEGEPS